MRNLHVKRSIGSESCLGVLILATVVLAEVIQRVQVDSHSKLMQIT